MSEFAFPATLTDNGSVQTVTAFDVRPGGGIKIADQFHPHWDLIMAGLRSGDAEVFDYFEIGATMVKRFQQVTERVSWNGADILWDGDPVHSALSNHLMRAMQGGNVAYYTAIAKFWEKLESNPEKHSRDQAFAWLAAHSFQITTEGDIVGYKGVTPVRKNGTVEYLSYAASQESAKPSAFVNGVPIAPLSKVPQKVGDVVTMPRAEVEHDPRHACKRGLHVAVYNYAMRFGSVVLEVHVNPRDICSVPTDGGGEKVRVNRYEVSSVTEGQPDISAAIISGAAGPVWRPDVGTRV